MAKMLYLFLTLLLLTANISIAQEQSTITVMLINAKSGKPMLKQNVTIHWLGTTRFQTSVKMVDSSGRATFAVPPRATSLLLFEGPRVGKDPERIAYLDCNKAPTTPGVLEIQIAEVLKNGVTPANACGKKTYQANPGELIFWAEGRGLIDMQ